ncbi:MAG: GspH/FimT family pseudopilin [Xanthomonadales bacterium]|uniref:GspH/FimT family pseudopilin n=1 Tax=Dokdonella sp. TaxID=2291710 RepID=UPI002B63D0D5|nr:GspH/FimT family pseudopilin [Xanthomonadales bacterium]HQV71472.1 GspH/FimT family pseudopilin [Dokdonella sp.]MBL0222297.1 GspH/FimT family pseudopilin [Xanthomonadales bacterium]HQW75268.1 GspH/FimT family pseudopilin [Dokdonella sp.]HQX66327.1 GspH/FimT family pseudopilin [Dokdonella sp.]
MRKVEPPALNARVGSLATSSEVQSRPLATTPHSRFPIPVSRGFTLIEMIVVIVLIGIVASVVTFAFTRTLASARIQAASNDLVAGLRYTRGQAIVKGEQKVLLLDLEKNTWLAPGKAERELPKDMILRLTTAQQELTSDKTGGIRFFPDGSSTGGNIAVVLGEREWKINVGWLTGEVTLDKPDNEK